MSLISIIVPIFNTEKYLRQCLDSILAQTYTNIEIILIDDGSTDNSPKICDEYALSDDRIVVIHQKNSGVSASRNVGLRKATGEYVMFCDSDDYVTPNWCKTFLEIAILNQNAWIFSNIYRITNNAIYPLCHPQLAEEMFTAQPSYFTAYQLNLSGGIYNKIYSLSKIRKNNIFFDNNMSYSEDACFDAQYCLICSTKIFIPAPLYYYRDVCNSLSHRYNSSKLSSALNTFKHRLSLIESDELSYFCDKYLYLFLSILMNNLDENKKESFFSKLQYNHKMMNTDEFKYCVKHASGEKESALFMKIVRLHNYYIYWLFLKLDSLKKKVFKRRK